MAEPITNIVDPMDWARAYLPAVEYEQLQRVMDKPLNISIRINTLKWNVEEAVEQLSKRYRWKMNPIPFCDSGFWVTDYDFPPSMTIEHRLGYFYIQEAASMLPPELFDFDDKNPALILDMAASPGGKTTHLAALSGDRGMIVANDSSRSRIPALQVVLRNWGAINQCTTALPGEAFGDLYPDTWDAVLLDAPCSMQGLRAAESHTSREITASEIESLAVRQARLLESALGSVKPGGQVVYSTCTLAPQEDELVLAEILEKFGARVRVDDLDSRLPAPAQALRKVDGRTLPEDIRHAFRLWPHTFGTAGFFTARLTKLDELPITGNGSWTHVTAKSIFSDAPKTFTNAVSAQIDDHYGFDLPAWMARQNLVMMMRKDRAFLVPELLLSRLDKLPYISAGMELGKRVRDELVISHEFISRFGDRFTRGILVLGEEYLEAWMRGEDLRSYRNAAQEMGRIYAVRDETGRNLGRGKLLADRLKNMLPTRLF